MQSPIDTQDPDVLLISANYARIQSKDYVRIRTWSMQKFSVVQWEMVTGPCRVRARLAGAVVVVDVDGACQIRLGPRDRVYDVGHDVTHVLSVVRCIALAPLHILYPHTQLFQAPQTLERLLCT
jgi:hypothetical protein